MNQYDRLIPDKNGVANMILKADVTYYEAQSSSDKHLVLSLNTTNLSFGSTNPSVSTSYNLSDAVGFNASASLTSIDTSTTTKTYEGATASLEGSTETTFLGSTTPAKDAAKSVFSLSVALASTSETSSTIYCYFNYNDALVKALYTAATGYASDGYEKASVTLACDFNFSISLVSGALS